MSSSSSLPLPHKGSNTTTNKLFQVPSSPDPGQPVYNHGNASTTAGFGVPTPETTHPPLERTAPLCVFTLPRLRLCPSHQFIASGATLGPLGYVLQPAHNCIYRRIIAIRVGTPLHPPFFFWQYSSSSWNSSGRRGEGTGAGTSAVAAGGSLLHKSDVNIFIFQNC